MLWPLAFYFVVVVGLAAAMLAASAVLGDRPPTHSTLLIDADADKSAECDAANLAL